MAADEEIASEDRPKVYLETSFMICPSIITPRSYLEDFNSER